MCVNKACDVAVLVKKQISMHDIAERYGIKTDYKGFICCPFHNEKTASMKLYDGEKGYYCFGCGAHGDVISFVQGIFGLQFPDALKKIDLDFNLGLYGKKTLREYRESQKRFERFQQERERKQAERERLQKNYELAYAAWVETFLTIQDNCPSKHDVEWRQEYADALHKMTLQEYQLNVAEVKLNEYFRRTDT